MPRSGFGLYQQGGGFNVTRFSPSFDREIEAKLQAELEQEFHEAFPLNSFFKDDNSQIYSQYLKAEVDSDVTVCATPSYSTQNIPIQEGAANANTTIERAIVQMLEIQNVVDANHQPKHFIHSWCDIANVTSVEAKRVIGSFFTQGYKEVDRSTWPIRSDIIWGYNNQAMSRFGRSGTVFSQSIRIYHYIGLGYPPPEAHKIQLRDTSFSQGEATSLTDLRQFLAPLCFAIFDCDRAAILRTFLMSQQSGGMFDGRQSRVFFVLFSCAPHEMLRIPVHLPQNFFSCVLLSPARAYAEAMHVKVSDAHKDTFVSLMDVITESIALDSLPSNVFYRLFRGNLSVSSLWRRFLLAQRLMKLFGLHCQSIPDIADLSDHVLWTQFDYGVLRLEQVNVMGFFSNLYMKHFEVVGCPAKYMRALAASLLQVSSEKPAVLAKIAAFMAKSPANCGLMASVLSTKYIGDFNSVAKDPSLFANWCVVVSGISLVSAPMGKAFVENVTQEMELVLRESHLDTMCLVYLASILVSYRDTQPKMDCFVDKSTIENLTPHLFSTSAVLREWIALLIHASVSICQVDPRSVGPTGAHAYATLLLSDTRKYARAAGVAILTWLLAQGCPEFTDTVMMCAMKAAIDGYSIIRLAFLHCVARYTALANDKLTEDREYPLDFFIRKDIFRYARECSKEEKPVLKPILQALSQDPHPEVREVASAILKDPTESPYIEAYQENGPRIHQEAHATLFSRSETPPEMVGRYDSVLFRIDVLEKIELRHLNQSKPTFLGFDMTHANILFGSDDGTVWWGDNVWNVGSTVVSIVHLPHQTIAVASKAGEIFLCRNGSRNFLEVFRPTLKESKGNTIMTAIPGTSRVFIAQGQKEILVWDLSSLLLVDHIVVSSEPVNFVVMGEKLMCALELGTIVQINMKTLQIEREYAHHTGQRIIKMHESCGKLYIVVENGHLYKWDMSNLPEMQVHEDRIIDFAVHRVFQKSIKITGKDVMLSAGDSDVQSLSVEDKVPVCCCFDEMYPMCAIGYSDGSYSVWRVPK